MRDTYIDQSELNLSSRKEFNKCCEFCLKLNFLLNLKKFQANVEETQLQKIYNSELELAAFNRVLNIQNYAQEIDLLNKIYS